MEKKWTAPTEIYVAGVLNNRHLDQNYIGDLSQSMKDKGFLPEFPIDVFLSENLVNIDTELPYVCACGAHRTFGAIHAKLERVLVHVHTGREEDFIEMMHLDNFQFDPVQHSGIGQPFTQKEKRAAVTQLLLLPKYFEQTNAALQEAWRIPESSLRRWRSEVVELLEMNSPKLRLWGISDGRLARLRELAEKPERVDPDGKVVKIRKPMAEATETEKSEFYNQMEEDSYEAQEKYDFDWSHLCEYMENLWDTDDGKWYIYKEVSLRQLQDVHHLILSEDPELIKAVQKIARAEKQTRVSREKLNKACDLSTETFKKIFAPKEDKWSQEYKELRSRFSNFVQHHDPKFSQFEVEYFGYDSKDRDDPDFCEREAGLHHAVVDALTNEADWLEAFRVKETARMQKLRENAMKRWEENRKAARVALAAYPRKIAPDTLLSYADRQLDHGSGKLPKLIDTEVPSTQKFTDTLISEADLFKKLADALTKDVSWVQEIPEPKPLINVLVDDKETEARAPAVEYTLSPDDLHAISLPEIFEHVQDRVINVPVDDESAVMQEIATLLGKASRGQTGTQLYLLMKYALLLKSDKAGDTVEKGDAAPEIDAVHYITISYSDGDQNELAFFNSEARIEKEGDAFDKRAIADLPVEVVQSLLQIAQSHDGEEIPK